MSPDALFWIASMSKGMTAAALMMLVDEGKVNVDDPVEKYLPEFHGQMVAVEQRSMPCSKSRSIRSKSGRFSRTPAGLPFMSPIETVRSHRHAAAGRGVMYVCADAAEFEPGTKFSYSNAGINTAGPDHRSGQRHAV